jgi:hypothetical protein
MTPCSAGTSSIACLGPGVRYPSGVVPSLSPRLRLCANVAAVKEAVKTFDASHDALDAAVQQAADAGQLPRVLQKAREAYHKAEQAKQAAVGAHNKAVGRRP